MPEPREPFALIVWENVAYLVDDVKRTAAYERLERAVGIEPAALLRAGAKTIEAAIREGGMKPSYRTVKVLRCAQITVDEAGGDLSATLRGLDDGRRRRLLKRYPGIADPGADKILLLCGLSDGPALESNGLRVLQRLHVATESTSYAADYRTAVAALRANGYTGEKALDAFAVLRAHGRELCKRTTPLCAVCPVHATCPSAPNWL